MSSAHAEVLVATPVKGLGQSVTFQMNPSQWNNHKLFGRSSMPVESKVTINFTEAEGYYGFAVLVCDEENARLYRDGKSANCRRYNIDSSGDRINFTTSDQSAYYLFIHNKTKPVSISRTITVNYSRNLTWPQEHVETVKTRLSAWMAKLSDRHGIEPYNIALVPCHDGYVPSSYEQRTLTLCSELTLSSNNDFSPAVAGTYLFYEAAPFLQRDLEEDFYQGFKDRVTFAISFMLTIVEDEELLQSLYDWHIDNEAGLTAFQPAFQDAHPMYKVDEMITTVEEYYLNPSEYYDIWLDAIYMTMNDDTLKAIREGELQHQGAGRNLARLILLDRENAREQKNKNQPTSSGGEQLRDLADEIF